MLSPNVHRDTAASELLVPGMPALASAYIHLSFHLTPRGQLGVA